MVAAAGFDALPLRRSPWRRKGWLLVLFLCARLILPQRLPAQSTNAGGRFEASIRAFEEQDRQQPPPQGAILFVGSSSIRLWDLGRDFPGLPVLNRGFGGSEMEDVLYYMDRIVLPYRPKVIVLYEGDNDLARGKSPEQIRAQIEAFIQRVRAQLPGTRIIILGVKPSLSRWALIDRIRITNRLIEQLARQYSTVTFVDLEPVMLGSDGKPRPELFQEDGLHLNRHGYEIWASLLRPLLSTP